jgi:hypothetical protein
LLLIIPLLAQDPQIKSLLVYPAGDETALPLISDAKDGNKQITIEFDVETGFTPSLNIVFRYCDRNWIPYTNLFLVNTGKNIFYNLDFETLPSTVAGARYHFKGNFPDVDESVNFPHSGKWRFYITDSFDTSIVYASGRFFVIHEETPMRVDVKREQLEDKTYFPTDLSKIFNLTASVVLSEELYPAYVTHMEVVENQKINYSFIVDRSFNTNTRQFYWNGNKNFTFTVRDVQPGNEYRQTDLRDYNKFISESVRAQFDGLEYSRFFKQGRKDNNGGMILLPPGNEYATYLNVEFSIRPPEEVAGSVYLVGSFNNWNLLPGYEMKNRGGVYSLITTLKRGIYDYQYVAADVINGQIKNPNWLILEGNSWETINDYHIFIYYNEPQFGGYDKIIAYQKVQSKK